ncbi:MAG: alpha/beta hydrolase [Comamonadaceae bacterium]|nr:MAG: alpha/beta hydrolase [Comamonadaceae bacterium]
MSSAGVGAAVPAATWVLLRGLAREARHWGDFGNALAAQLGPAHRVLALDLPGNGVRHGETSPATVAAIAAAGRADLARRGIGPPYVLVALSLGAMVALQWCDAASEELAGCVLLNTSLRGISPFWQRLQPRNYLPLAALLRPATPVEQREARLLELTSSQPEQHAAVLARWAAIARQYPVAPRNAMRQLLAAARYRPPVRAPALPLLVLASQGDTLVSPQCSQRLAARWQAPLALHPWAGHDLPLDDPDWVLREIARWWRGPR